MAISFSYANLWKSKWNKYRISCCKLLTNLKDLYYKCKIIIIGLTFWVLSQRQNEMEYKHTFIHEHMSEQKLVRCEMNTKEEGLHMNSLYLYLFMCNASFVRSQDQNMTLLFVHFSVVFISHLTNFCSLLCSCMNVCLYSVSFCLWERTYWVQNTRPIAIILKSKWGWHPI